MHLHASIHDIGRPGGLCWPDAISLTRSLAQDPTSRLHAARAGWQFAASREWFALANLYDAFLRANFKDPERAFMPRPWTPPPKRHGTASMSPERLRAVLARHRAAVSGPEEGSVVQAAS